MHSSHLGGFPYFCRCCGGRVIFESKAIAESIPYGQRRCEKHVGRDPCAIEGCSRTTATPKGAGPDDGSRWLCSVHWKIGVPPRSMLRRQYHRYFRLAKRHGWEAKIGSSMQPLRVRFWLFWHKLVEIARKRCSDGDIDVAEIHRMFGWD